MKKLTTVVSSALLMGAAMSAGAQAPAVPAPYGAGPLKAPTYMAPNLFVQEKTAFALLEGAMQAAEGIVYTSGCSSVAGTWDLSVEVFDDGAGSLDVSSNGVSQLSLSGVAAAIVKSPGGTVVKTSGTGNLKGKTLNHTSTAYYNTPGAMMVQSAVFGVKSVNGNLDPLSGTVIKDFWKETSCSICGQGLPIIYDWGLQSVSKNYVPQDKWWQRSYEYRSDGVFGRTHFRKDRLYSAKNGGACTIDIDISGTNDADFFGQTGSFVIRKATPTASF
jgi:hypothetical protein